MEGRVHDQPARITGYVPRLVQGEPANAEAWRRTLKLQGLSESASADGVEEGEFHLGRRLWTIAPRGEEATEARVIRGKVKWLRSALTGSKIPTRSFRQPAVSVLTGSDRARRSVVPIEDIPQSMIRAVVAIEDERFFRHRGIDPRGIARALVTNLRAGGVSQGGSTITQQLAKNMFLRADRTLRRKFQEALLAVILEQQYSKEKILEAYLNEIYLGQRNGYAIMGVGEAARVWFGKDIANLSLSESALLAGAIHSPNRTVPWRHHEEAKRRRNQVLKKMRELEAQPLTAIESAIESPVRAEPGASPKRQAPWFVDAAVAHLSDRYTPEALHREGLELVTTLDLRLQTTAEAAVNEGLAELRSRYPELWSKERHPEVALVALDPSSGAVRAMIGGSDYVKSQFNRATQAKRQPGSAFKPVVLTAAIGDLWPKLGPRSVVRDTPIDRGRLGDAQSDWVPKNYDGKFDGPVSLRDATNRSRNLPFVRLANQVGLKSILSTADALGIQSTLPKVPSIAIGAAEVTPIELARVYATLASGGVRTEPHYLVGVRDGDGEWLERDLPERVTTIDPRVAAVVTDLLESVVDHGTARAVRKAGVRLPIAGKTGTSNKGRDSWMAGYSTDLSLVVWVGYDSGEPLGLSSTQAALPIWSRFMTGAEPFLSGDKFKMPRGTRAALSAGPRNLDPQRRSDLENEDAERRRAEAEELGSH